MARREHELTRTEIVAAALGVADENGLGSLTMRDLAQRFRCTPMALYRHVDNKDALINLVADDVLGELEPVRSDISWQDAMVTFFGAFRQALIEHPSVAEIMATRPIATDQTLRHAEHAISVLGDAGFDDEVAVEAFVALSQYTLGASLPGTSQALHHAWQGLEDRLATDEFPTLARTGRHLIAADADQRFGAGLEHLILGYQRA